MTAAIRTPAPRRTALALAALAALAPAPAARADDAPAAATAKEAEGSVTVGFGVLSGDRADRAQFGQYNGLRTGGNAVGLLGFDYYRRNGEAGTSVQFLGTNLLLDTRELDFSWKKQGDWKFGAGYGEEVRHEPYTIDTGLAGAGTTTPQVTPLGTVGSGADLDLKIKRTRLGLAFWKSITPSLQLSIDVRTEDRDGARLFGSGMTCPSAIAPGCLGATGIATGSAVLLLPEPIDANHTQVEARLSYADAKLRLSGGYYGSFYTNSNGSLAAGVPASLNNPVGTLLPLNTGLQSILNLPLALPPDNQAHHFDLTGNYSLARTTQVNFKLAYARAVQNQDFAGAGLAGAPAGVANLGGRVDTKLVQVGVTSHPIAKLSLLGEFRYQDKDDRTPLALYNIEGTSTYTNRRLPLTRTNGKVQASYQFTSDYRGTLAADYEAIDRGVFTATSAVSGISALRRRTEETGVRAELRRTMSETVSGAISVESSRRDGSDWLKPNSGTGVTAVPDPADPASGFGPSALFDPTLADRRRDKIRLRADWQPSESLSIQLGAEDGRDRFSTPGSYGLESTGMSLVSLDADYVWSEQWRLTGYLSRGTQRLHQSRFAGYILSFRNTNTSVGLGIVGKPAAKFELGGGITFFNDRNEYAQALDPFADGASVALLAATGGLPDVVFRQTTLRLYGRYEIDKSSAARIDLVHQRSHVADWAWAYNGVPFTYADGTTLDQKLNQAVTFVGVTYTYRWH